MLFHDNIVAHRKAESGSLTCWFGRKERIEHLFLHFGGDAGAVVVNANFHGASQILRRRAEYRLKAGIIVLGLALGRGIKSVRDQVEKGTSDFLRKRFDCTGAWVEVALQGDIEPGTVPNANTKTGKIAVASNSGGGC